MTTRITAALAALCVAAPLAAQLPTASRAGPTVWQVERGRNPMTDVAEFFATLDADVVVGTDAPPSLMVMCSRSGPHIAFATRAPLAPDTGRMRIAVTVRYDATPAVVERWITKATADGFAMTDDRTDTHPFTRLLASHGLWIEIHTADRTTVRAHFTTSRAASLAADLRTTPSCQRAARKT